MRNARRCQRPAILVHQPCRRLAMSAESTAPEVFLPVVGFTGYDVGTHGTVRSYWRLAGGGRRAVLVAVPRLLTLCTDGRYLRVTLCRGGKSRSLLVHRLVLEAFVGPCPDGMEGAHGNGIPTDNRLTNLAWKTPLENHADKKRHGTNPAGERHGNVKLNESQVREIRNKRGTATTAALAKEYGVSKSRICDIQLRRAWAHIE